MEKVDVNTVALESKSLPVCNVKVMEKTGVALIDSGAASSLIKQKMLSEVNRKGNGTSIVKGLGDSSIKDCKTVTLQFSICDLLFCESFLVVPD